MEEGKSESSQSGAPQTTDVLSVQEVLQKGGLQTEREVKSRSGGGAPQITEQAEEAKPEGPQSVEETETVVTILAEMVRRVDTGERLFPRILAEDLLRTFFHPLVRLRDTVPGYAVSLVKAGVTMEGVPAGPVRPPLVMPTATDIDELASIVAAGRAVTTGALSQAI